MVRTRSRLCKSSKNDERSRRRRYAAPKEVCKDVGHGSSFLGWTLNPLKPEDLLLNALQRNIPSGVTHYRLADSVYGWDLVVRKFILFKSFELLSRG